APGVGRAPPKLLKSGRFSWVMRGVLPAFPQNLPAFPKIAGKETGSYCTASTTTHSRFLPTCGDAPKMPANGGLFQRVLRVSRSPEEADGRFRTSVSAAKNPVPGARKGVVPRVCA